MIAYEIIRCDYCDFESARNAYSEKSLGLFASAEAAQGFLNTIPVTQLTPYLASGGYGKEVYPKFKVKTHMVYD